MAPQNKKRTAQDAKVAKEAKVAKVVVEKLVVDPVQQEVFDALELVDETTLPTSCRDMLLAMLPSSLGEAKIKRNAAQIRVVDMIQETLSSVQTNFQQALEEASNGVATVEGSKALLEQKVTELDAMAKTASDAVTAQKATVSEVQSASSSAEGEMAVAEVALAGGNKALEACRNATKQVQNALDVHLTALCAETPLEAEPAKEHLDALISVVKVCSADESLQLSVASLFGKPFAERGDFDNVVLDQIKKMLANKISEDSTALESADATEKERTQAVDAAKQVLDAKQAELKAAKEQAVDLEVERQNAMSKLDAAKAEVAQVTTEVAKASKLLNTAKSALEKFADQTLDAFNTLKGKKSMDEAALQAGA